MLSNARWAPPVGATAVGRVGRTAPPFSFATHRLPGAPQCAPPGATTKRESRRRSGATARAPVRPGKSQINIVLLGVSTVGRHGDDGSLRVLGLPRRRLSIGLERLAVKRNPHPAPSRPLLPASRPASHTQ